MVMKTTTNKIFGQLIYDFQWEKQDSVLICGKEIPFKTIVEAFPGESITELQEKNYQKIKDMKNLVDDEYLPNVYNYLKKNYGRIISTKKDLYNYVELQSVLYKQNGKVVALFSIPEDELGVGIELIPVFSIGVQDLYL